MLANNGGEDDYYDLEEDVEETGEDVQYDDEGNVKAVTPEDPNCLTMRFILRS